MAGPQKLSLRNRRFPHTPLSCSNYHASMRFKGLDPKEVIEALIDPKDDRYIPEELVGFDATVVGSKTVDKENQWRYKFSFRIKKGNNPKKKGSPKDKPKTLWYSGANLRDVELMHAKLKVVRYTAIMKIMKEEATRRSARLNDLAPDDQERLLAAALASHNRAKVANMVKEVEKEMERLASCTIRPWLNRVKWSWRGRGVEPAAKRRKSTATRVSGARAEKKGKNGARLAISWALEQVKAAEVGERLARTLAEEEGYSLGNLLKDPEVDGHLSQPQTQSLLRRVGALARFYHIRSTVPDYMPRSAIAKMVDDQSSFGPIRVLPWRTVLLWEQEFREQVWEGG